MADISPMMKQYLQIKQENPDTILFFRLGDFYEMFFEDAVIASKELELTLTGKSCGQDERAPMCGVPFHSCEGYIARLVSKGYKVAICEQTEDPALAKGIVKREVVRVVTPGTVIEGEMLDESTNNYLSAVYRGDDSVSICFADISTGIVHITSFNSNIDFNIQNELSRFEPKEIIVNEKAQSDELTEFAKNQLFCPLEPSKISDYSDDEIDKLVLEHFEVETAEKLGLFSHRELCCVAAILIYLKETQMSGLQSVSQINVYSESEYMALDRSARYNLELFKTMRNGDKKGSLLWVLDRTKTAMGKRKLRSWLEHPLVKPAAIIRRLNAVQELYNDLPLCDGTADLLSSVYDMERLISKVVYGSANPQDLLSLATAEKRLPEIKNALFDAKSTLLQQIRDNICLFDDIVSLVFNSIDFQAPTTLRDGNVIAKGFNAELDGIRDLMNGGNSAVLQIEEREKQRTGIKNLRIKYNKVFGYYIEVTNSFKHLVPDDYIRKQTTLNSERYITEELKNLEHKILSAKERAISLENTIFNEVRNEVAKTHIEVKKTANAIAELDVLISFAVVALKNKYTCPEITADGVTDIKSGRHPVVESVSKVPFVPNDTLLDAYDNRCAVITGPNMAGKSTYMRQTALITIMAQIGSFVPALSAKIGVVDAVFTRVGASDDLFAGQSTFMVEMNEVAFILKNATKNSLIILDEIGRGTATYDGMSIANAVLEYISSKKIEARTLFATHYHELTMLEGTLAGVKNYNIAVKKRGDDITFLRRIMRGPADRSYGIEVAALAGVPKPVVDRAKKILKELESGQSSFIADVPKAEHPQEDSMQISLAGVTTSPIIERLKSLDVDTLTPIEAMTELYNLSKAAKEQ